jgi:hypothetical protein
VTRRIKNDQREGERLGKKNGTFDDELETSNCTCPAAGRQ